MEHPEELARQRTRIHDSHREPTPEQERLDTIGLAGELALGAFLRLKPNLSISAAGDPGYDYVWDDGTLIDAKTAQKPPKWLLVKADSKLFSDIYVLARYWPDDTVSLLGWEFWERIRQSRPRTFGDSDIVNFWVTVESLHPMKQLREYLSKRTVRANPFS